MRIFRALTAAIILTLAAGVFAQDAAKVDLYNKFMNNYKKDPAGQAVAREAVKQYVEKYGGKATSEPEKKFVAYVTDWAATYDKALRSYNLIENIKAKKTDEAFAGAKDVFADNPEDLDAYYNLARAGYEAAVGGNHKNDVDAIVYAKKAIELLEAGKNVNPAKPFTDAERADEIGYANFMLGTLESATSAADAKPHFIKAITIGNSIKGEPSVYVNLYKIYNQVDYVPLADRYKADCGSERLAASQDCKDLKGKADAVLDKMIDALARAIAYANVYSDPTRFAQTKPAWLGVLTPYYKYRHAGSDSGLDAYIKGVTATPLPN